MISSFLFLMTILAVAQTEDAEEACLPVEKEVTGTSLQGQLMPGQTVTVLPRACHPPQHMDFIVFTSPESDNLVIKQIWGMPGDTLTVGDRGNVFVNGEQVLTPFDKPYVLNPFFTKKLKIYEGELKGYLALGHPGSLDSGRTGPIPLEDIVGVVTHREGRQRN